jgi:acyl-CoA synthetase (AMP-forming)/AMP-acid ligase II
MCSARVRVGNTAGNRRTPDTIPAVALLEEIDARLMGPGAPFEIVEEEVLGEPMQVIKNRRRSLRELLEASAAFGDKEYIVYEGRRISYAEHLRQVASVARALRERYGVEPGDRVAILAANCPEWIITFWATVSLGGIVAALNGWWMADEVVYGVNDSAPKLVVGDRKRLARVEGQELGVPVVEIESGFKELLDYAPDAGLPQQPIAEDGPAVILYTSGTTGRPKGAVVSHRGICGFVQLTVLTGLRSAMIAAEKGAKPEANPPPTRVLVTVPLFHMSGLYTGAVMMLAVGAATVWRAGRFDPEDVLRLIESERITTWAALGSMAPRVLHHPNIDRYDLSSIRNLGQGGAPTSPELLERIQEVAPNGAKALGIGYGLSEAVATVAMSMGDELAEHPRSAGRVQPTHEVEIRAPDGAALPEGEEGEIHVRSPYLMLEYWRSPETTAAAIKPGRWFATGDIGRVEAGRLYINSRARDMILRAAENIHPIEIEQRLEAHPKVSEAAVVGVDHPELGQEVKAVVVPAEGARIDTEELARWAGEALTAYKVPTRWEVRAEPLPRNAAGKVLKNVLLGEAENKFVEE